MEGMHDESTRFTALPEASTVSSESLMKALSDPGEATSVRIQDLTAEIQTRPRDGQVRGSLALDEPLQKLEDRTSKLKRTIQIADASRKNLDKTVGGGQRLTPPLDNLF